MYVFLPLIYNKKCLNLHFIFILFLSNVLGLGIEARFRHWIKNKKRLLRLFISQFWLYFSELCDINSRLWVIKSELQDLKSELRDINSEFRIASLYHAIMIKKSQNSEIKSRNNFFSFFIQWQKQASIVRWHTFTFTFMHLADAFIQSDLQYVRSGYTFVLSVHVFPGNRTHNLCAANAMLNHWATGTHKVYFKSSLFFLSGRAWKLSSGHSPSLSDIVEPDQISVRPSAHLSGQWTTQTRHSLLLLRWSGGETHTNL